MFLDFELLGLTRNYRSPSQSLSLSQELSLARSPQRSISPPTLRHQRSESLLNNSSRPTNIAIPASPSLGQSDRSPVSLQKEIMRLQDVLKEREEEINQLENALQEVNVSSAARNLQYDATPGLSPNTMEQLSALRTSIIHEVPDDEEAGDESKRTSLGRLDELMLSMAQKESQHREQVEDLTTQLKHVRRQFDDLTTLSRDQVCCLLIDIADSLTTIQLGSQHVWRNGIAPPRARRNSC
jgi:hypothetical protein